MLYNLFNHGDSLMDRSRKFCSLIAALALAGFIAVACDSGTQEPDAPDHSAPGEAADSQNAPVPLPTDGQVATIPETFAEEVPIYPGSVPAIGKGAVVDGVSMAGVQLQSSDDSETVYDFYAEKFSRDGWTIEKRDDVSNNNAISATNGKCTALMLAAPDGAGGTSIFLVTEC